MTSAIATPITVSMSTVMTVKNVVLPEGVPELLAGLAGEDVGVVLQADELVALDDEAGLGSRPLFRW